MYRQLYTDTESDINLALEALYGLVESSRIFRLNHSFRPYIWSFFIDRMLMALRGVGGVQSALIANRNRRNSAEYQVCSQNYPSPIHYDFFVGWNAYKAF